MMGRVIVQMGEIHRGFWLEIIIMDLKETGYEGGFVWLCIGLEANSYAHGNQHSGLHKGREFLD